MSSLPLATRNAADLVAQLASRVVLVGLLALVMAAASALPADAASYSYVSLKAVVTGSTVQATGVVKASSPRKSAPSDHDT